MIKSVFGNTKEGVTVYKFKLSNSKGMRAVVTNYGAILVNLIVPDKFGVPEDVVMGYDTVAEYEKNPCFFGSTIAPSANRIDKAKFTIDGVEYNLPVNDGENNLHSDYDLGAHKRVWDVEEVGENSVKFTLKMKDMELGFPGNKVFTVTYTLTEENELKIDYTGTSDKNTLINPTNHSYFNLGGHGSGTAMNHIMRLECDRYTVVREGSIPTGENASVKGTPMDFTKAKRIGENNNDNFDQFDITGGIDHNFVINDYDGSLKLFATVEEPNSGRLMKVYTTLPGVQFYAGNYIGDMTGKDGASYGYRGAFCLETQFYPNAINIPSFVQPVFGPEKPYASETVYRFEI